MTATHGEGPYGNAVGVTTPIEHKMAQVTEFVKTTTKNVIRPGVLYNGDASLVAGTAGMSYDVDAFSIVTQRSATSGVVKWANDGTVNVATTAAPGSDSRYDVVYAWHREYALDGVDSNPVIGVVQGTASSDPQLPSLAAFPGAVELARILVPAGVVATNTGTTFTQTAPFTTTDGGTVVFRTTTEMNAWTTALTGQLALDLTTMVTYRWSGAAWKLVSVPFAMAAGIAQPVSTTADTVVTFPAGRFTVPPVVVLGPAWVSASGALGGGAVVAYNTSATQFSVRALGVTGVIVNWVAVQMTSTTAGG